MTDTPPRTPLRPAPHRTIAIRTVHTIGRPYVYCIYAYMFVCLSKGPAPAAATANTALSHAASLRRPARVRIYTAVGTYTYRLFAVGARERMDILCYVIVYVCIERVLGRGAAGVIVYVCIERL